MITFQGFQYASRKLYAGGCSQPEWFILTSKGIYPLSRAFDGPAIPKEFLTGIPDDEILTEISCKEPGE